MIVFIVTESSSQILLDILLEILLNIPFYCTESSQREN